MNAMGKKRYTVVGCVIYLQEFISITDKQTMVTQVGSNNLLFLNFRVRLIVESGS